jgi:hypothetical protein
MTVINGADRRRQSILNLDHVVGRIEMIDRDGANRTRCGLIEHEAIMPLADCYCVAKSDMHGIVVAVAEGDRIKAAELVIHHVAVAIAEDDRVLKEGSGYCVIVPVAEGDLVAQTLIGVE